MTVPNQIKDRPIRVAIIGLGFGAAVSARGVIGLVSVYLLAVPLLARAQIQEPTPAELEAARAAFAKLGATYTFRDPRSSSTVAAHTFTLHDPSPAALAALPQVPFPFGLALSGATVTNASIKHLAPLKNLTSLSIRYTEVTHAGLKNLVPLKNLRSLDLSLVTDETMRTLREVDLLHTLAIATARGGRRPATPEDIEALDLGGTGVTDAGLKELAPLKNLTALELPWLAPEPQITAAGLKELTAFHRLTTLTLGSDSLKDAGAMALSSLPALTTLTIWCKEDEVGLKRLGPLPNLLALTIRCSGPPKDFKAEGIQGIAHFANLRALRFDTKQQWVAVGLKELATLKTLTTLELTCRFMPATEVRELAKLRNLTALNLQVKQITDETLGGLRETGLLHGLSRAYARGGKRPSSHVEVNSLDLSNTDVTDGGLKELATLTNLTSLGLSQTQVTDVGMKELLGFKNLRGLNLAGTKVTDAGVKELQARFPGCMIVKPDDDLGPFFKRR